MNNVSFELKNKDRVLILKDALFNSETLTFHDIKIERGFSLFGFGFGKKFTEMTDDLAREIQTTYGIVLKTLNANPGEVRLWGTIEKTHFKIKNSRVLNTSYSLGQKKDDTLLASIDAAHYNREKMTLHDAIRIGIWNIRDQKAPIKKDESSARVSEQSFDHLSFLEQKKMVIEYLDAKSKVPFSSFANQNIDKRIQDELFENLWNGLHMLALDPKSNEKYAKKMRRALKHWYQRGVEFFTRHSKPGVGYQKFLDVFKEEKKAKEKYFSEHATFFWLSLIHLFAEENLEIEKLQKFLAEV